MQKVDVKFASEGTTCRGWLFLPDGEGPFPAAARYYVRELVMAYWSRDAPVRRLHGAPTLVSYRPPPERAWLPSVDRVVGEICVQRRDR